ncbi:MAG: cyclic nucleotide-binding domain-containing protein [Elusimicrobia bacterium]|nr:cyclic nucleotide-binding domain-containing protein [Elusimicrobiota bacterium]
MLYEEKIRQLRALHILRQMPERQLAGLAEFLRPREVEDGGAVFEEGSTGMSLYFISSGRIRIAKRVAGAAAADLAVLGPGEYFGEMALVEEVPRSASAIAVGRTLLFELFRGDLTRWVKTNGQQAVQFFADLLQVQSQRLRRASNELALHSDLADLMADQKEDAASLAARALDRVVPHLESAWSAAAYLCKEAGGPELAASRGPWRSEEAARKVFEAGGAAASWIDDLTFHAPLVWQGAVIGHLLLHAESPLRKEDREKTGGSLALVARLLTAAVGINRLLTRLPGGLAGSGKPPGASS